MKEDMSLSNLGTVAFHAAKVPTNVFSSTLICLLTLDYENYFSYFLTKTYFVGTQKNRLDIKEAVLLSTQNTCSK